MADALELCQERLLKQEVSGSLSSGAGVEQPGRFPQLNEGNRLFADFSEEDLALVMQMSRRESYQAGETIVKEGAGGSTMYLVVRGRVSVRKMSGPDEIEIQQISSGECFGEMAVISQMPRSATVVALRSTEVIAISGAVLRTAGQVQCMKLYRNIASLLVERVRHRDEEVINLSRIDQQKRAPKRLFPFW